MELSLIISILVILIIFVLLTFSKSKNKSDTQENFFENHSPSPGEGNNNLNTTGADNISRVMPIQAETSDNPGQYSVDNSNSTVSNDISSNSNCTLYEDMPFPMDTEGKVDYNDLGLSNCYLHQDLVKILKRNIGDVNPELKYEDKKLIIHLDSIHYSNLTSEVKEKIHTQIKESVYLFMNQKYKKFKKQDFNIRPSDVKITAFSGSTYIIIEIISQKNNNVLSENDREILEFYNFKNILNGKKPISTTDFLYNTYFINQDLSSIISEGDLNKLQKQLNTLHLLLLEQNRKSVIHTHNNSKGESISPNPSPSHSTSNHMNMSPNPSPSHSTSNPINMTPNPSPSDNTSNPMNMSPNPSPSDNTSNTSLGPVSSSTLNKAPSPSNTSNNNIFSPNPSPSNSSSLFSPQPSPS